MPNRLLIDRPCRRLLLTLAAAALAGCAGSPPVQLYHLRSQAPVTVAASSSDETWQLLLPVRVPEYLDREAILLPQGQTGLLALSEHRWAESLRDAVPRVLAQDLATLLGEGRVWTAPLPAGMTPTRRLRVEIGAFDVDAGRSGVSLQARWTLVDPLGRSPARTQAGTLHVASTGSDIDSLVAAHRLALWQLAQRIAGTPR